VCELGPVDSLEGPSVRVKGGSRRQMDLGLSLGCPEVHGLMMLTQQCGVKACRLDLAFSTPLLYPFRHN